MSGQKESAVNSHESLRDAEEALLAPLGVPLSSRVGSILASMHCIEHQTFLASVLTFSSAHSHWEEMVRTIGSPFRSWSSSKMH